MERTTGYQIASVHIHSRPLQLVALFLLFSITSIHSLAAQMIVAHRGASHDAPENTLAAFQEAWNQNADGIEGDFYVTADQKIVCIHDEDTQRTGGRRLTVSDSTLAELRQLEYGQWKDTKFAGEPIPTFEDVLRSVPAGKHFVIELKTGPHIAPLLASSLASNPHDPTKLLIISFDADTIGKCKELLPNIRAHWLTSYKQNHLTGTWSPSAKQIAQTIESCRADGLGTKADRSVVTKEFVAELKSYGVEEFHVWTVDSPEDAKYFQDLGAIGITTNRPAFIRKSIVHSQHQTGF